MQVQVRAWGNSQGVRLTKEMLRETGITLNDVLNVETTNGRIILSKPFRHKTLEERAEAYGGKLGLSEGIDWGLPVGMENSWDA